MIQERSCSRLLPIGAEPFVRPAGEGRPRSRAVADHRMSCACMWHAGHLSLPKPLLACLAFSRRQHFQHLWE